MEGMLEICTDFLYLLKLLKKNKKNNKFLPLMLLFLYIYSLYLIFYPLLLIKIEHNSQTAWFEISTYERDREKCTKKKRIFYLQFHYIVGKVL